MSKVFLLGDFGVDIYHIGEVRGISAEAPIPVLDVYQREQLPAMAGNVAVNLAALGVEVVPVYPGGEDYTSYPRKNRLVTPDGHQIARWDTEDAVPAYRKADLLSLLEADAVVVADYGKGSITPEIVDVLKHLTAPTFVDTKQDPRGWVGSEAMFFPNRMEFELFQEEYSWLERVVIKLGADGVAFSSFGQVLLDREATSVRPVCVNGAGDTVLAAFVSAALDGCPLPECLDVAMIAAGLVVEKDFRHRTVTVPEILSSLRRRSYAEAQPQRLIEAPMEIVKVL